MATIWFAANREQQKIGAIFLIVVAATFSYTEAGNESVVVNAFEGVSFVLAGYAIVLVCLDLVICVTQEHLPSSPTLFSAAIAFQSVTALILIVPLDQLQRSILAFVIAAVGILGPLEFFTWFERKRQRN